MGKTVIINYGMGNLGSVLRSFEECGAAPAISHSPADLDGADRIVLPGVGAFSDGMAHLNSSGWSEAIRRAAKRGIPVLGICLGMQLLADRGDEGGETAGLGLIGGEVARLAPTDPELRVPHIGWNQIHAVKSAAILRNIGDGTDFYFVHSYHFMPRDAESVIARTPYGSDFVSIVGSGNIFGVQFHPEKSSKAGFAFIKNFLNT